MDSVLLTAIAGLLALVIGEMIEAWQIHPRPGSQVCQECIVRYGAVATVIDYLLYLPLGYAEATKWPLVVYLHGAGERGQDLNIVRQAGPPKHIQQGNHFGFILVSPQCPARSGWSPEIIVPLIEHISNTFSVDRDRVYLTGYSMGGFGVWQVACCDPDRFAAIVPLCGGGDVDQAGKLANVPIWVFHGDNDRVVPLASSRSMVDSVKRHGGHVKFTVYSGCGHSIQDMTYQNPQLWEWLIAQRRGVRQ